MGIRVFLGATEIVAGVLIIARRDHYAALLAPHRVDRGRALLLAFGVLLLLVGAFQLARALI
jgi:drug/metabolite transporter (DMT)-like permease